MLWIIAIILAIIIVVCCKKSNKIKIRPTKFEIPAEGGKIKAKIRAKDSWTLNNRK